MWSGNSKEFSHSFAFLTKEEKVFGYFSILEMHMNDLSLFSLHKYLIAALYRAQYFPISIWSNTKQQICLSV